jgi:lipopolysaccharide/colanic/teichoic acid biosynthesis glycosyltransferase
MAFPSDLMEYLMEMGITVNYSIPALNDDRWPVTDMRKLGDYRVLTSSLHFATAGELALKRAMDILGGLAGCLLTGLIVLCVGPAIYRASPGPIFFTQERVGQNGKTFKMYKLRSMYMDAEERKAALMAQNKIQDGMMFKMDDDPRIIGSEKKDKNGKPKGIGNFIRNTPRRVPTIHQRAVGTDEPGGDPPAHLGRVEEI